ncbi:MAG TPA: hypothetical protein VIL88_12660 [Devosia sp.]|jgi:hypothetical protein|uniref:hypothetical protein n=1 Tax=Devosia sp. TaxID=1871048 RepID=UPI002F92826F
MFELFPRATAYRLAEALHRYGDPELAAWLDQNASLSDDEVLRLRPKKQEQLLRSIDDDIRDGCLIATAFQKPITISSQRERISFDIWEILRIDVTHASASVGALELSDIKIQENVWASRVYGLTHSRANSAADHMPEADQEAPEISLSEDLVCLRIGSASWRLTGEIQQEIIRQLVEAFPNALKTARVLSKAGSNADTIPKAFTGSPNWPTLQHYVERFDGNCRLLAVPQQPAAAFDHIVREG